MKPSTITAAYDQIRGNYVARRAIEIAAAGGHHVLLVGAPESQREILARALCELLPPMTPAQREETALVYASSREIVPSGRPFRVVKPGGSVSSLLGGGAGERAFPGDVSLAHNGVLYFDEFEMVPNAVRECLRAPLEDGNVVISCRVGKTVFPARFQMVAATLPCPCGYYPDHKRCQCTAGQRHAFLSRLSGSVVDRIALQVRTLIPAVDIGHEPADPVEAVRERVLAARNRQLDRFREKDFKTNDEMAVSVVEYYCRLDKEESEFLERMIAQYQLSARAYFRILKIARTIADLQGSDDICAVHLAEAISYRFLDRLY